jgi:hypothetical protein
MEEGRANVKADGILEQWWVMRVAYQQELKAKAYCDNANVTSFIPMRYATTEAKGRRKRRLVPAIHNLIFIRESEEKMKDLKPCMEAKKDPGPLLDGPYDGQTDDGPGPRNAELHKGFRFL